MSASRVIMTKTFARDNKGNVAMIFGLMAIPVLGLVGTAIDFGRASSLRQELQSLTDGAALAATNEFAKSGDADAATERLRNFISEGLSKQGRSLLPEPLPGQPAPSIGSDLNKVQLENGTFNEDTASVNPKLTARVETTLLALLDQPYFEIQTQTKAGLAGKKLELSMMLDVTGSMCDPGAAQPCSGGAKLSAMKSAALDLVDIVFGGNASNTRVAVVPFSSAVNVGSFAAAVTGQPATSQYSYACGNRNRSTCYATQYRTNCVAERSGTHAYTDDAPRSGRYSLALWSTSSSASCTPASAASILPLTNTRSAIEAKINGLRGQGGTAGHLGTGWAWYTISNKWASFWGPASAPEPVAPTILKAAVLMTDGEYTMHYGSGANCNGSTACSRSISDALTLCANMKAQGIRVFTVGFQVPDEAKPTLQTCASPGDFHFPYNPAAIREAFQAIGNALIAGSAGPVIAN